ncbi:MAG TPA: ATP-binding protein, partial [Candidatus Baltobacteraceae bacterium]|nr:ATP-binding protein [Candidatus Baltobacteraceae bacterium]
MTKATPNRTRPQEWGSGEILFIALLVLTIAVRFITYRAFNANQAVAQGALQARFDLQTLARTTLDEETATRAFLASNKKTFLERFERGLRSYPAQLAALRRDLEPAPFAHARAMVDRYDALHSSWLNEERRLLSMPRGAPRAAVQADTERRLDGIAAAADRAQDAIEAVASEAAAQTQRVILWSVSGIVTLTIVLGTASLISLRLRYRKEHALHMEMGQRMNRLAVSIEELERQRSMVIGLNQSKNDLIAVLAHDIKGPLTSIVGFAELLEEGYLEGEGAADAARTIRSNAQRLATLANDVLALSHVEHGELEISDERVDLIDVLQSSIDLRAVERKITFEHPMATAFVRGDAERLRQVCGNIVENAIKYSPGGEPIDVGVEEIGESYRVMIRDRGIGIPPDEVHRLFGRFARATNARRAKIAGTGIGLFIVKMIVERHGGTIDVASVLNEGSTFVITLPKIESASAMKPMRVAIVSSDLDMRRFAAYELRSRGYRVREAESLGELALAGDMRAGDIVLSDDGGAGVAELRAMT